MPDSIKIGVLTLVGEHHGAHVQVTVLGDGQQGQRPLCGRFTTNEAEWASLHDLAFGVTPQFDAQARIQVREAIAYLKRIGRTHACTGTYCEHCVITKNLDDSRRWLFPTDPLGDVDPDSPYAGCGGEKA